MTRYGIVVDVSRCIGCYACFIACKDEHCGNDFPPISVSQPETGHYWMRIIENERGKYPKVKANCIAVPCQQCDNPPCVCYAENNAVYKRPDGIVIIDPEKSKGQKNIMEACPYRLIYWNEEKNIPQKCTFCAHLLDQGWKQPRCVEACPVEALVFGDLDDPQSEASKLLASGKVEVLHSEYGLKERVQYIGLPKKFVAGTVVFGYTEECGENAVVTLSGNGEERTVKADNFGDWEFDGLGEDKEYIVKVSYPGYQTKNYEVRTKVDVFLGDIVLSRS